LAGAGTGPAAFLKAKHQKLVYLQAVAIGARRLTVGLPFANRKDKTGRGFAGTGQTLRR